MKHTVLQIKLRNASNEDIFNRSLSLGRTYNRWKNRRKRTCISGDISVQKGEVEGWTHCSIWVYRLYFIIIFVILICYDEIFSFVHFHFCELLVVFTNVEFLCAYVLFTITNLIVARYLACLCFPFHTHNQIDKNHQEEGAWCNLNASNVWQYLW
jgi:hypothetical protein